ncbi:MAG: hypothetical protein ABIH89_05350 [Elusimicrobiota bacterium]
MKKVLILLTFFSICNLLNNNNTGYAGQQEQSATPQGVKLTDDKSPDKSPPQEPADNTPKERDRKNKPGGRDRLSSDTNVTDEEKETSSGGKSLAEFRASVDKSLISIGDKIKYTMEIDADKSMEIGFPAYASNLGGFAVRDFGKDKPVRSGRNRVKVRQWYVMDTYTTGSYVIPSQFARVRTPEGKEHTLKSPEIFVEVKSVIGDDNKDEGLRDIKFPIYIPFRISPAVIMSCGFLIIAGFAVWILYRRRKSRKKEEPPLPAHEQALLELEKIESMALIEKNQVKEYYYMVSDVLRRYLEGRFSLRAPEQTTEEFLDNVTKSDALEGKYINLLKEYLMHCDMVKYAKLEPDKTECSKLIDTTRRFVEQTKPVENEYIADYTAIQEGN